MGIPGPEGEILASPEQSRPLKGKVAIYEANEAEHRRLVFSDDRFETPSVNKITGPQSSPEGTHELENGQELRIFDPKTREVVWQGEISFVPEDIDDLGDIPYPIPDDFDKKSWLDFFANEYPAELTEASKPAK